MPSQRAVLAPDWEALLDDQEASGLSVAEWCRRRGMPRHLIYPRKQQRTAARSLKAPSPSAFVPVHVVSTPPLHSPLPPLRIELVGGRVLEIDAAFDDEHLRRILAVVEALPCC